VCMSKHLTLGLIGMIALSAFAEGRAPIRFNAEWWQRASSDEQQGFIYGYFDCRHTLHTARASIVDYQDAVTRIVESEKTSDQGTVDAAIERALKTVPPRDSRGAEHYDGPHGFLDGGWWEQGASGRGYVEGYLDCGSTPVTVEEVRRYEAALDRHFASGRHEHEMIADVLSAYAKRKPAN
jgi:hypothetical protein